MSGPGLGQLRREAVDVFFAAADPPNAEGQTIEHLEEEVGVVQAADPRFGLFGRGQEFSGVTQQVVRGGPDRIHRLQERAECRFGEVLIDQEFWRGR